MALSGAASVSAEGSVSGTVPVAETVSISAAGVLGDTACAGCYYAEKAPASGTAVFQGTAQ